MSKQGRISIEIAVRIGTGMYLSIETADAHWWLLLRSAAPRDAKFVAARAIAPTEQSGKHSFRLVLSYCAGGLKVQTKIPLCSGGMNAKRKI